jgi:hypothetical protein
LVVVVAVAAAVVMFVVVVRNCSPYQNVQIAFGVHDISFSMDTVFLSSGVKGPELDVD